MRQQFQYLTTIALKDLKNQGYHLLFSSSIEGPGGYTYSAYMYLDSSFPIPTPWSGQFNLFPYLSHRFDRTTEGCRIAFYRSDGESNELLKSFVAPKYTQGSIYHGYPVYCLPNDWSQPSTYWWYGPPNDEQFDLLSLNGVWSDINQNSLPEFAVLYQYCENACLNNGAIATHFYEIQTTSKVENITKDLPGVVEPYNLVYSTDPVELQVYDPTLWYCYKWCVMDTWWIYSWDGEKYIDVSQKYSDEYRKIAEKIKSSIQDKYPEDFFESELLTPLFLFEKAGQSEEGLELFLELSNPSNWTGLDLDSRCWLDIARQNAISQFEVNKKFTFPQQLEFLRFALKNRSIDISGIDSENCNLLLEELSN